MRAILARAALVMLGLAGSLAAVEGALRVVPLVRGSGDLRGLHVVRPDRPWLYGMRPGAEARLKASGVRYVVNADGFRDGSYRRPKPSGTFRVVVLGDSIAFGYGVALEQSFPKLLEARLRVLAPDKHVEVLNLGVSGYNAYTEAALFADVGVAYEPDLVLVQFCINDLNDPTLHFDASTMEALGDIPDAAFPDPARRRPPPSTGLGWCRALQLCRLIADALAPADLASVLRALETHDEPSDAEITWLRAQYAEIARVAAEHGARFAVLVFPYRAQLEGRAPAGVEERLAALGAESGWVTVDLLPAFRAASSSGPLFLDLYHPTTAGHRVAADAILVQLGCRGLVPGGCPAGR